MLLKQIIKKLNKINILQFQIMFSIQVILILLIIVVQNQNTLLINQLLENILEFNYLITESINSVINNLKNIINLIKDIIIPTAYAEELELEIKESDSYKVDTIRLFAEDLHHIKISSLYESGRWETIRSAVLGDLDTKYEMGFGYYKTKTCLLSDINFKIKGDLFNREYELKYFWPQDGYILGFKPEEGLQIRKLLGLNEKQTFQFIIKNEKTLPVLPNDNTRFNFPTSNIKPTIFETNKTTQSNILPEYDSHNFDNLLPSYDQTSENNVICGNDNITPTDSLLERAIVGNNPTRFANELDLYKANQKESLRIFSTNFNNTSQISDVD